MSGLEIAGLILGVIPLLTEALQVTRSLKERCKRFRLTKTQAEHIENTVNIISNELLALQRQYSGVVKPDISVANALIIEKEFSDLEHTLRDIVERFKSVSGRKKLYILRDIKDVVNTKKPLSYGEIIMRLDQASDGLRRLNHCFVNVSSNQRMLESQDRIIGTLESLKNVSTNRSVQEEAYIPSFYVPSNPPIAKECLDYGSVDEQGNHVTFEGILKADLLRLVQKRHNNHSELPIIEIVGMRGVGKTCALRGLGAEEDIREMFHDGILFLSFSQSSSEQDVKAALCSIVSQTGGRNLAQEMKESAGRIAIQDIITKVSGWFDNRKCLFLIDNIWDTPSTGSALLTKLSTVLQNCNTTSGLVYTTTNEIDLFDATIRFTCLSPYGDASRNILTKAAGFTLEQIVEADQEDALMTILDRCKGLKIALVVAGRNVRLRGRRYEEHKALAWESYASVLTECPQILLTEDYGDYGSLYSQLSITLRTLSSLEKQQHMNFQMPYSIEEAFQAFCILDKGEVMYDSMLCRVLQLKSIHQAREVAELFADVSLLEITCKPADGISCEEFRVHDLVLDFASHLADQKFIDRNWIMGSEVWVLRLLESYFGGVEGVVLSSSTFTEWWDESRIRQNTLNDEDIILLLLERIIASAQIESGQNLSDFSSQVDRMYVFGERYRPVEVVPFFTVQESALVTMYAVVNTLARERNVHLSGLTRRVLIIVCLFFSKLRNLLCGSSLTAMEAAVSVLTHKFCSELASSTSGDYEAKWLYISESVIPSEHWKYIMHMIVMIWTLYDDCIKAADLVDAEHYHILGPPLEETILMKAGIRCDPCLQFGHNFVDDEMIGALHDLGEGDLHVYEWRDSDQHFLIVVLSVFVPKTISDVKEWIMVLMYLHDLGNADGATTAHNDDLRDRLCKNIQELVAKNWFPVVANALDNHNVDASFPMLRHLREATETLRENVSAIIMGSHEKEHAMGTE